MVRHLLTLKNYYTRIIAVENWAPTYRACCLSDHSGLQTKDECASEIAPPSLWNSWPLNLCFEIHISTARGLFCLSHILFDFPLIVPHFNGVDLCKHPLLKCFVVAMCIFLWSTLWSHILKVVFHVISTFGNDKTKFCSAELFGVLTQTYSKKMLNDSADSSFAIFFYGVKYIFQFYSSDWHLNHFSNYLCLTNVKIRLCFADSAQAFTGLLPCHRGKNGQTMPELHEFASCFRVLALLCVLADSHTVMTRWSTTPSLSAFRVTPEKKPITLQATLAAPLSSSPVFQRTCT